MKRYLFILAALAYAALAGPVEAATCYWVGGTGNIDDVTKWSNASGGSGSTCASVGGWPNASTEIGNFDANSGGGTITRNVNWTIGTLNISAFTGTFGNAGDTASVTVNTFTNNGSGVRTVNLGAGTWSVAVTWAQTGATNLTFNPNTSTVQTVGPAANAAVNFNLGTFNYNIVTLQAAAVGGAIQMTGSPTMAAWNIQAPNYIRLQNGSNITITGSLTFSGGGSNAWTGMDTAAFANSATLTLRGGAATCNYCSFRDITAATNSITATNSINYGRATNISITPPSAGSCPGRVIGG